MPTATCYIIDNSPFARKSDILPNLLDVQRNHIFDLFKDFTEHSQSSISIVQFGQYPSLQCPQSNDKQIVSKALNDIQFQPQMKLAQPALTGQDIKTALNFAQLAIGQRQNKEAEGKIEFYIASPLALNEAEMAQMMKKLKKEKISIKFILVGKTACQQQLLVQEDEGVQVLKCEQAIPLDENIRKAIMQEDQDDFELQQALALSRQEYYKQQQNNAGGSEEGQDFGEFK